MARKAPGYKPSKVKPSPFGQGQGHRGIAAGSLKKPDLESYRQRVIAGTTDIPASEVEAFLNNEHVLMVHSTNVHSIQYFPKTNELMVEYDGGQSAYLYKDVSPLEALQFVQAQSKGGAVWDVLRVRGSATAHRKPYTKIR